MASGSSQSPSGTLFQTYLLPAIPFRRRRSGATPASLSLPSLSPSSHGTARSGSTGYFGSPPQTGVSPTTPLSPVSPSLLSSPSAYEFRAGQASSSRHASQDSSTSSHSGGHHYALGSPPLHRPSFLSGHTSHISCAKCHADLALTSQIISKGFTGRHGRAYLVSPDASGLNGPSGAGEESSDLPNIHLHRPVPRHLVTGLHTVADISCAHCALVVGWKYVAAEEESQQYKIGKFILETRRCSVGACWENEGPPAATATRHGEPVEEDDGSWFFGGGGMEGLDGAGAAEAAPGRRRRSSAGKKRRSLLGLPPDTRRVVEEEEEEEDEEEEVMFDSQDEDECEDLFAGVWSPALAKQHRARKGQLAR